MLRLLIASVCAVALPFAVSAQDNPKSADAPKPAETPAAKDPSAKPSASEPAPASDVKEVTLRPDNANPLMYDAASKTFTVKAGQKVKVTMENKATVPQPHNLIIVKPGTLMKVGAAANGMLTDPQAMAKSYIPESPDILWHTKLVNPGSSETLEFTAPAEAGDYPYLCTFPGHWILMQGVMKVEK